MDASKKTTRSPAARGTTRTNPRQETRQTPTWIWPVLVAAVVPIAAWLYGGAPTSAAALVSPDLLQYRPAASLDQDASQRCPQAAPLAPQHSTEALGRMDAHLRSTDFVNGSLSVFADAIRIPTEAFDDMGPVGVDPRWNVFDEFASFLQRSFPLVHSSLDLEKVNSHGLLYTWRGSDPALKPTVLMAHQDVVPVPDATAAQWTHPPYGGVYDGRFVWGRGALDCKNTLVGILEAVEALLAAGFEPRRSVVLSFGFDEEISGRHGASKLGALLVERYGRDGAAAVLDEGAPIMSVLGRPFAIPGVSEKGYVDVEVIVRSAGGHSSMPPEHTSVGIAARLVRAIEEQPYAPWLYDENPILDLLWCGAEQVPGLRGGLVRSLLPNKGVGGPWEQGKRLLLGRLASLNRMATALLSTTQAVDVIGGGVKVNALPERTRVLINHRVNVGETSETIKAKLTELVGREAASRNLALHAFNDEDESPKSITIRFLGPILEPAPVSPSQVRSESVDDVATPWSVLAGTTRELYGEQLVVAPAIMPANTDTKYYWDLSRHIFRFFPGWDPEVTSIEGIHTVDERATATAHVRTVQWYSMFLRNMDEASML